MMIRFVPLFAVLLGSALLVSQPVMAQDARPQLALQIGHMARVTDLAVSPDGTLLASAGADKTAKIWNAATGSLRFSLPHDAPVLAVAFQGNSTLVTADASGAIRLYDTASGGLRAQKEGGQLQMSAAALSRDGKWAAFARPNGQIDVLETGSGKTVQTLDGHPTRVLGLAFSPDGQTLASCSDAYKEKPQNEDVARRAGDIRLWDVGDGELIRVLRGHALGVHAVAWSNDGKLLASVGESGTAVLWNTNTWARQSEINVSQGQGRALSATFSPNDSRLIVGWRGGVQSFDLKNTGTPQWTQKDLPMPSLAALSDGRVVAGNDDGELEFLAAKTGAATPIEGRVEPLTAAHPTIDGNFIACAATDGSLCLWNAHKGALLRAWMGHIGVARDLAFTPDGTLLASAGDDKAVRLWKVPEGRLVRTAGNFTGPVTSVAFSLDGKTLAAGSNAADSTSTVTLWSVADGKLLSTLTEPHGAVNSLSFAPDGALVATCGSSAATGEVLIWDAQHKLRTRQTLHGAHGVAISPDGKRMATVGAVLDETQDYASAGDEAQLWSLRAGEMTRELTATAPDARALAVAFASDSKTFATASRDGAIRIWDTASDTPLRTLQGHSGPVNGLFFTSSGQTLVSVGNDGTVRVWNAGTGRLIATLLNIYDQNTAPVAVGTPITPDWLAVTPEGYYEGSPAAGRFVQWRLGSDVFPVEAFEGAFMHPALMTSALRGDDLATLDMGAKFASGKVVPPQITITTPKAGQNAASPLTVQVAASDDKSLKSVQLFINGRPAASQAITGEAKPLALGAKPLALGAKPLELGAKPLELGAKPLELGAKPLPASHDLGWQFSLTAPLPPSDGGAGVTVRALVTDADGLQGSDEIRLNRPSKGGGTGTLRVLAVGVSGYANPAYNLRYSASDANAFAGLWKGQGGGLFEKTEVTTLTDAQATSGAVQEAMRNIAQSATPDDVVAIFLSGHGIANGESEFYFATHDVNLDKVAQTTVPWTAFQEALAGSKARRVVIFLDACHSGGAIGTRQAGNAAMAAQLVKNAGAIVFSSSLGTQNSFELDDVKHGAFTEALIEGIGQGKADLDAGTGRDGVINVEELLTFLRARVPQLTDGAQMPSCPLLQDFGEPFPLARVK